MLTGVSPIKRGFLLLDTNSVCNRLGCLTLLKFGVSLSLSLFLSLRGRDKSHTVCVSVCVCVRAAAGESSREMKKIT